MHLLSRTSYSTDLDKTVQDEDAPNAENPPWDPLCSDECKVSVRVGSTVRRC